MKYKMIIFDWDGTLMDSAQAIVSTLQTSIAAVGLPERSEDDLRYIIGLGMYEALDYLYPNVDVDADALAAYYRKNMTNLQVTDSPLYDGTVDMLKKLKAAGYLLAVATGKSRMGLDETLEVSGLSAFFAVTKAASETRSKPHPLMLEEILEEFGLDAHEALMVGDTEFDILMAQAIKMDCVAVEGGAHNKTHLQSFAPTVLLHRAVNLPQWLAQQ